MDPNQQPQDFNKPNEPAEEPTTPGFGAPSQPEFSQPVSSPTPVPESPTSQAFGQPVEASQPATPQPAFPSPELAPAGQPPVHTGENPGQVLGIISIVVSFIGLSLVGIILGAISRKKSKAVGASTTLGTVGIVIGIVFTVLGLLMLIMITLVAQASLQDHAKVTSAEANAAEVRVRAEAYYATTDTYPATIADFEKDSVSSLSELTATIGTTTPTDYNTIQYMQCSEDGAQVSYYDPVAEVVLIVPLGTASSVTPC